MNYISKTPEALKELNLANVDLQDVDKLVEAINVLATLSNKFKVAYADKKISLLEGVSLGYYSFNNIPSILNNASEIWKELKDKITADEIKQIANAINKSDYLNEINVTDEFVLDHLNELASLKNFATKWYL